jgi:Xaa-Pro aminopeptidase
MDRRQFNSAVLAGGASIVTTPSSVNQAAAQASNSASSSASGFEQLRLPESYRPIFEQNYPRFSDAEYTRRHTALAKVMEAAGLDHVLIVTSQNVGNATVWMTGWRGTTEALTLFKPGEPMTMWVEYYNHQPQCRQVAKGVDVRWGEEKGASLVANELVKRGAKKIGVIGPLSASSWKALEQKVTLVSLGAEYIRLRLIKSEEEIAWMRIGGALSDLGMRTLISNTKAGMTEHELANMIERSYVGIGGIIGIHFIGSTQMSAPDCCVPRQWATKRKILPGDFVFCELTSTWWDYSGQVLRGFTVESEPSQLYKDLHATAFEAFNAITKVIKPGVHSRELIEASSMIETNGFTTYDDLVHGYGGGYFQPILGSKSRPAGHPPSLVLEENMCMVVQPNVITKDEKAGVQLGHCVRVTKTGFEHLHHVPLELFKAGQAL